MAGDVKIGSAYFDIRAKADKIKDDVEKIKSATASKLKDIENSIAKIRPNIETNLLKKTIADMESMSVKLKAKLEEKIKLGADLASIERTKEALDAVNGKLSLIKNTSDEANSKIGGVTKSFELWNKLKGIGTMLGLGFATSELISFMKEAVNSAAELEVLRSNFKGSENDLELFRVATARTVTDANLIKLSNQATDLGLSLQQQAIFFSLAEDAADKYGGGVEEGMQRVIIATEGSKKALKDVGIQKKVYDEIVSELTQSFAKQGGELDAEADKQIRIEALIKASGLTIEDVKNKVQDSKDKLETWGVAWDNIQRTIGSVVLPVLFDFGRLLENAWGWATKLVNVIGNIPKEFMLKLGIDISDEALGLIKKNTDKPDSSLAPTGSMERLAQDIQTANAKAKEQKEIWTVTGKTVEDIKKHIESLQLVQKTLIPGTKDFKDNIAEIKRLTELTSGKSNNEESLKREAEIKKQYYDEMLKVGQASIADELNFHFKEIDELYNKLSTAAKKEIDLVKWKATVKKEIEKSYYDAVDEKMRKSDAYQRSKLILEIGDANIKNKDATRSDTFLGDKTEKPLFGAKTISTKFEKPDVIGQIGKDLDEQKRVAEQWADTLSSCFVQVADGSMSVSDAFKTLLEQLAQMVVKALIFRAIWSAITGGASEAVPVPGAHSGGNFIGTSRGVLKMARGGSFTVPSGFNNDSFPLMVETGERVTVTPANQIGKFDNSLLVNELRSIQDSIHQLHITTIAKSQPINISANLDVLKFTRDYVLPAMKTLTKGNIKTGAAG